MSVTHFSASLSLSSSTSTFLGQSTATLNTSSLLPMRSNKFATCKCAATSTPEKTTAYKTGVSRNANMGKLQAGYLFPEIARRRAAHMLKYPDTKVISLGIEDTTEPIPQLISSAMAKFVSPTRYSHVYSEPDLITFRIAIL